ncbi:MAG: glycosyltransferase [Bacteroidetes bacterium]|nr:glycosyltransferase [Bacteroidota bacterium]
MKNKHLHIISFDVPYPANYGGVIDVFYKLKALHAEGIKIHLHCFEYGRAEALSLETICEKVYYYKRNMNKQLLFSGLPFVVISRSSEKLMENLLRDNYPILFEGLHSCYHMNDERLKGRVKLVRTHNIEHDYYKNLQKVERSVFKKIYFGMEAKKLERFEKVLKKADAVAAISPADTKELSGRYKNVHHITAFHPNEEVNVEEGFGKFCLYHGNLEVGENNEAALFLVDQVFSKLKIPLIIAGRKPSLELTVAISNFSHIQLKANINTQDIDDLIKNAQINVLPTFQSTGIKLKLLAALFTGRHCVVNTPMIANTGLEGLCSVQDAAEGMKAEISRLFELPFDMEEKKKRETILIADFSNAINVKKLAALI